MGLAAIVVIGVLYLTVVGLLGSKGVATVPPREGMVTTQLSGLEVFNTQGCAACHTIDGVGGTGGPELSKAGFRWTKAAIRKQILTPKDASMPAYTHFSEQELNDLVDYLASLQ